MYVNTILFQQLLNVFLPFVLELNVFVPFVQELNVFGPMNTPSPDLRRDLIPEPEPTSGCLQFLMRKKKGPNNSGKGISIS